MKLFSILFLVFFLNYNGFSQRDSISNVGIDPWYIPTKDGTGYTIKEPKLEEALDYFQKINVRDFERSDKDKIRYYTLHYIYCIFPKGDEEKDLKIKTLTDLLVKNELLHAEYPKVFIEFFYKNHKYFNQNQKLLISKSLEKLISSDNLIEYQHIISQYQITSFIPQIKSLLEEYTIDEIKSSVLDKTKIHISKEVKLISTLANLDQTYQEIYLDIIRNCYEFTNIRERKDYSIYDLKTKLYHKLVRGTMKDLTDKKEITQRTLYLLDEDYVIPGFHGDNGEEGCAFIYYKEMVLPLLTKNRKFANRFIESGIDDENFFRNFFETHRTSELMRAALIEFGILEK